MKNLIKRILKEGVDNETINIGGHSFIIYDVRSQEKSFFYIKPTEGTITAEEYVIVHDLLLEAGFNNWRQIFTHGGYGNYPAGDYFPGQPTNMRTDDLENYPNGYKKVDSILIKSIRVEVDLIELLVTYMGIKLDSDSFFD